MLEATGACASDARSAPLSQSRGNGCSLVPFRELERSPRDRLVALRGRRRTDAIYLVWTSRGRRHIERASVCLRGTETANLRHSVSCHSRCESDRGGMEPLGVVKVDAELSDQRVWSPTTQRLVGRAPRLARR
jgi:hypothetical protein